MNYILEIDDHSMAGKHLIGLVKTMLDKENGIELVSESEIEKREDMLLSKMISEGMKSGLADTDSVLAKLKIK